MRELFFRCHYEVGSGRHEEACSIPGIHWFVLFLQCHKESGVEAKSNGAKPKYLHLIYNMLFIPEVLPAPITRKGSERERKQQQQQQQQTVLPRYICTVDRRGEGRIKYVAVRTSTVSLPTLVSSLFTLGIHPVRILNHHVIPFYMT